MPKEEVPDVLLWIGNPAWRPDPERMLVLFPLFCFERTSGAQQAERFLHRRQEIFVHLRHWCHVEAAGQAS
ncbi:hypothetical protein [Paraburkholderia sp. BL10I2N1]|uniref:hypothetical protein n=1 Tax=Paraburkholderia sp. BL10I2N1 TaxID=1938796 RepID=UPI001FB7B310|nr:hypothetical protein [Paraburkholderia sp. BL10I2N1]